MKPSAKMITTVTAVRWVISGCCGTSTARISSVITTNHGSWRGPSTRLASTSGTTIAVSGTRSVSCQIEQSDARP